MDLMSGIFERAKKLQKTVVLPESLEERNLRAAAQIDREGLGPIVLIGNEDEIRAAARELDTDLGDAIIRDPDKDSGYDAILAKLVELRAHKGMTEEKAAKTLKDPIYYAAMMVKMGMADAYVSGAINSTANTMRPALQLIKTAPGFNTVSSFFIMVIPETSPYHSTREVLFFADCAIVQNPDSQQLADIAVATAGSWKSLITDEEPRVAMLSHSSHGSASHPDVDKVTEALRLAREQAPGLQIGGELQADAALIDRIGQKKAPGCAIAGRANVLIFPDLDAANIGYKLVERLAGAAAIGPIVQGLAKPVNDLSRGCSVQDIVDVTAVTACQAAD